MNYVDKGLLFCSLLLIASASVFAGTPGPRADYDANHKVVIVSGLVNADDAPLANDTSAASYGANAHLVKSVHLQSVASPSAASIFTSFNVDSNRLTVRPILPLLPARYLLNVETNQGASYQLHFDVATPTTNSNHPTVLSVGPSTTIPANTLRLYVYFSEPMARGQVADFVSLKNNKGQPDQFAFLNLATELWGPEQKRLTLLFDPGRVKKDVGPNLSIGAPLTENQTYQLVISKGMKSVTGLTIENDVVIPIKVEGAERRKIALTDWAFSTPEKHTYEPLQVHFGRLVDPSNVKRNISIVGSNGEPVPGRLTTEAASCLFVPDAPWAEGSHYLVVSNDFEDIVGNRLNAAFDSIKGTLNDDPVYQRRRFTIE